MLDGQLLTTQMPALIDGLAPAAMYLVLSEVEKAGKVERRTRLWEIWSPQWRNQVELPKVSFERKPDRKYRWDIVFLARPTNFIGDRFAPRSVDLKLITHATRNALDI
ncbi:MAG: hypothetical protein HC902_07790 [Calothrix sp. SM1_5_4]|nr:hypothetical protein [Calothrix sp. SM1_5_4]